MNGRVVFVFVATALATFWFLRYRGPRPADAPPTVAPPIEAARPASPVTAPRLPTPAKRAPVVATVPKGPPEELYRKYVPFRVENGLAVAYGDIILGAVDDGTPEEGFHEPEPVRLWTEREIPYGVATTLPNPARVHDAIQYLSKATGLVFVPLVDQRDGIVFEPGSEHCLSALGKTGGRQPIRLAPECGRTEILHEMLHALGFLHEHSRSDRDAYVQVLWENVDPKFRDQFRILPASLEDPGRGTPFDFESVMLYPSTLFAKEPGLVTLQRKDGQRLRPVRDGLSAVDIRRIRDVYH